MLPATKFFQERKIKSVGVYIHKSGIEGFHDTYQMGKGNLTKSLWLHSDSLRDREVRCWLKCTKSELKESNTCRKEESHEDEGRQISHHSLKGRCHSTPSFYSHACKRGVCVGVCGVCVCLSTDVKVGVHAHACKCVYKGIWGRLSGLHLHALVHTFACICT